MTEKLVNVLLRMHPQAWRRRYGAEVKQLTADLIETGELSRTKSITDLVGSAVTQWTRFFRRNPRRLVAACGFILAVAICGSLLAVNLEGPNRNARFIAVRYDDQVGYILRKALRFLPPGPVALYSGSYKRIGTVVNPGVTIVSRAWNNKRQEGVNSGHYTTAPAPMPGGKVYRVRWPTASMPHGTDYSDWRFDVRQLGEGPSGVALMFLIPHNHRDSISPLSRETGDGVVAWVGFLRHDSASTQGTVTGAIRFIGGPPHTVSAHRWLDGTVFTPAGEVVTRQHVYRGHDFVFHLRQEDTS